MQKKIYVPLITIGCSAGIILLTIALQPTYVRYKLYKKMTTLKPLVAELQSHFIAHAKRSGSFPQTNVLSLNNTKLYDITAWAGNNTQGPIAVIQASVNGQELGMRPRDGGMVTCLLANRNHTIESKCFYQIKPM